MCAVQVLAHTNNVFELVSIRLVKSDSRTDDTLPNASRPGVDGKCRQQHNLCQLVTWGGGGGDCLDGG